MSIYMEKAVALANIAAGQTGRNPAVGAIIVKDGFIIGTGSHLAAGTGHAEVRAIQSCITDPAGADMYVTLEPCSHYGSTPPCTDAIIEAGITRVFYAVEDKNPQVSGHEVLEENNIVAVHQQNEEAAGMYEDFFRQLSGERPNVTLKAAMSIDGRMALDNGESKWVTNEASRHDVQHLRHTHDAILVGGGTLLADDPRLTARIHGGGNHPLPVILMGSRKLPESPAILQHPKRAVIFTSNMENEIFNKHYDIYYGSHSKQEILDILHRLYHIGSVLVEGGPKILTDFINENLYDQIIIYTAPKLFGKSRYEMFQSSPLKMAETIHLELAEVEKLQSDLKLTYRRN